MLINVVQKAQGLFQDFPAVADSATAKQLALANPLFSWHATYTTRQHKKIVLLVNDACMLTVVLTDVNAKNRQQLATRFWAQLEEIWQYNNLPPADFDLYRRVAKPWETNRTVTRSRVGRMNDTGAMLTSLLEDGPARDEAELAIRLTQGMRKDDAGHYHTGRDLAADLAAANMQWHPVVAVPAPPKESVEFGPAVAQLQALQKICDDLSVTADLEELDKLTAQIQAANTTLLENFDQALTGEVSAKTKTSYLRELTFYLNEFLAYRYVTILDDDAAGVDELLLHGVSVTEAKRIRTALRRLYRLLAQQNLVTEDFASTAREIMSNTLDEDWFQF